MNSISNPAHPLNPANPANPASPLHLRTEQPISSRDILWFKHEAPPSPSVVPIVVLVLTLVLLGISAWFDSE